jgi:putative DNA primase/helicase
MMPYGQDYQPPADWELPDNVRQLPPRADRAEAQHRGQVRMAYRLADSYAGRLMHVYGLGWLCWDGKRWAEDQHGMAKRAVIQTLRAALAESFDDKELREDVRKCETAHGISGVLDIASALEPFAVTVDQLDADPHLLNTDSGVYDLTTGELRPHHPRFRCTKITTGAYRPAVTDGPWHVFLRQALPDDDVRAYFRRVIGLALLGSVREHVLPIATGSGGNGKGVACGAILHALGGYGSAAESDLFTAAKSNANAASPALMGLRGRRFVVVSETERDQPLAEALMKMITGGDPITARPLYGRTVSFAPSHTALLVTNHLPRVSGDDEAIWRRLRVIPFDQSFRDRPDTGLGERLRGAADEVLSWAIAGWGEYDSNGLAEPDSVKVATRAYRTASDALARFVSEVCVTGTHVHVGHSELLAAWRSWCAESGELPGTERAFSKGIEERGYPPRKTMTGKRYQGLSLPAEEAA